MMVDELVGLLHELLRAERKASFGLLIIIHKQMNSIAMRIEAEIDRAKGDSGCYMARRDDQ